MLREVTLFGAIFTNWDHQSWFHTGRCAFFQYRFWRSDTCSSQKTYACEKPVGPIPATTCDTAA